MRPLGRRTGFHTLDRWLYNAGVMLRPPRDTDLVLGVDLDGFLWARRRALPFVASLKGIIADELKNERGRVRALLAVQARWERRNVTRADLVMVTSRYSAEVAQREYGVAPERLAVVPEPIRKRIQDLLHAAGILRERVPGVQVRVVGRGPEWPALSRLHAELGLGDSVTLLGDLTRERLAEEYVNATVFCLPSVQEGFGIVFLEAMAAELPVVGCRIAAVPEVVLDGVTGLLSDPRDPGALAGLIERLIADPALARRLGREGRRRALGFSPRHVAERFLHAVHSSQDRLGQQARGG